MCAQARIKIYRAKHMIVGPSNGNNYFKNIIYEYNKNTLLLNKSTNKIKCLLKSLFLLFCEANTSKVFNQSLHFVKHNFPYRQNR